MKVPLRVDLAGGWLDVPRLAIDGAFIVNCAISPLVSLEDWPYEKGSGLGGSAAYAILSGKNAVDSEISLGVGWQDPAVITETGLCVWRSGVSPVLEEKVNPDFLNGLMALKWLGTSHFTPDHTDSFRNYVLIKDAGFRAVKAVTTRDYGLILDSIHMSYVAQRSEGMTSLPFVQKCLASKYCGGGWGGYALCMFGSKEDRDASGLIQIEPYMRQI
jgi:hypothetical protein